MAGNAKGVVVELDGGVKLMVPAEATPDDICEAFLLIGSILYHGSLAENGTTEQFSEALDSAIDFMKSAEFYGDAIKIRRGEA